MLDLSGLSADFDTLDHTILKDRLSNFFGFSYSVFNRSQSVIIVNKTSIPRHVELGIHQRSILGHLLFVLYVVPLQDIVSAHNHNSMFYGDDSQIYISINPNYQLCSLIYPRTLWHGILTISCYAILIKQKVFNLVLALLDTQL